MRNNDFDAFWKKNWRESEYGCRSQDSTKKLAHRVELVGEPLSQKYVFENLWPEPSSNFSNHAYHDINYKVRFLTLYRLYL